MKDKKCFDKSYCLPNGDEMNYEGEMIILKSQVLSEEFKEKQYQLWVAYNGNGCTFGAKGQAVFAVCLADGEKAHWERKDFEGVADLEKMPEWAVKSYENYQLTNNIIIYPMEQTKDDGMEL